MGRIGCSADSTSSGEGGLYKRADRVDRQGGWCKYCSRMGRTQMRTVARAGRMEDGDRTGWGTQGRWFGPCRADSADRAERWWTPRTWQCRYIHRADNRASRKEPHTGGVCRDVPYGGRAHTVVCVGGKIGWTGRRGRKHTVGVSVWIGVDSTDSGVRGGLDPLRIGRWVVWIGIRRQLGSKWQGRQAGQQDQGDQVL